uniref:Kinesin-like protein n=1 Tax=Callorhinchus milii TaxID=7868 RepID=A0A4W3K5K7_CALMI
MSSGENDVCNHLKVIVRVRPENSSELDEKYSRVVHVVDEHMLVFDPKLEDVNFFHPTTHRDLNKRRNRDLKFIFDQVFDDSASQLDVFEQTRSILEGVFNGYNGTVFAYGATGAGKTHTMLGSPKQPGVMYLTMMELYNRMEQIKSERSCDVAVSYFEVYNEQIRDLLTNSRSLAMREDAQNGIVIQGLTLHKPKSAEQLLAMLDYGNTNRTQHPTDANSTSSRSHAVFQIYLRQQDRTAYISQSIKIAKMCLVDLAGSERNMSTKVARLREGANINRSLLALGNVINALADPKRRTQHIPYRNSKLTRILKDSLGGNCRTIMIVSISPSSRCYEDTYNTLNYANRAKAIKSSLKSNVLNLDCHVSKYAKICEEQKKEVSKSFINSFLFLRFKEVLKNIFSKRQQIRNENLDLQLKLKETELKSYYHKRDNQQIQLLCSEQIAQKALWKHEHRLAKINAHCLRIQEMKKASEKLFEENSSWLHQVERKTCLLSQDKKMPQVLQQDLHCSHLKMEVMDLKRQIGHMIRLLSFQESENKRTENLVNALLPAFRHQYYSLKKVGQASAATESQFMRIEQLVQQEKGVVWADETVELSEITSDVQLDFSSIISFSQLSYNQDIPCCTYILSAVLLYCFHWKNRILSGEPKLRISDSTLQMVNDHIRMAVKRLLTGTTCTYFAFASLSLSLLTQYPSSSYSASVDWHLGSKKVLLCYLFASSKRECILLKHSSALCLIAYMLPSYDFVCSHLGTTNTPLRSLLKNRVALQRDSPFVQIKGRWNVHCLPKTSIIHNAIMSCHHNGLLLNAFHLYRAFQQLGHRFSAFQPIYKFAVFRVISASFFFKNHILLRLMDNITLKQDFIILITMFYNILS